MDGCTLPASAEKVRRPGRLPKTPGTAGKTLATRYVMCAGAGMATPR